MINTNKYQVVIGLEVHAQLLTQSKLFCADPTGFGASPNTQVSPISLAHPGTLPKMNERVIEHAIKLGLALHCEIEEHNYFARKNYFYPDLPKGYQVSQHTAPICKNGFIMISLDGEEKKVLLNRIHMEEDAGKSIHDLDADYSMIDLNRAGMPLLEIVTEPCLHSAEEAHSYLTELRKLLRWLDVCDGNMEEGSMRCDANISIRQQGETNLGTRVEVKNLNSIRNVKRAIETETLRLIQLTEQGENILQETRSFDADNNTTFSLRSKEEADDYRYFPEPDLPPFVISKAYQEKIASTMPTLPGAMQLLFMEQYHLSSYDAAQLCSDKAETEFYLGLIKHTNEYKAAANWMTGPLKTYCNEQAIDIGQFPLSFKSIAQLIALVQEGKISFKNASTKVLLALIKEPTNNPEEIARSLNLIQESDHSAVEKWVDEVISLYPDKVREYRSGKKALMGLFAGEVKRQSSGKADMQLVNKLLAQKLNN